jgi:hypothetical protein
MALVRTDVSEECFASNIRVIRIGECACLVVTVNVPSSPILVTLMMEAIHSTDTSVLTRAAQRYIQEVGILHSHLRENVKFYIALIG